ncbi:MAG: Fic family protein [bacterium]|nr:Fic family protein [bacterium]
MDLQPESPTPPRRGRPRREEIYRRVRVQVGELENRLGGLPSPAEAAGLWRDIWYEEAHHSTAIEGNTLVLKQVERLLNEGKAVGNKELAEYLEVRGYANAAEWVYEQAITPTGLSTPGAILTLSEVRHIHHTAMAPVWEVAPHPDARPSEAPGSFREHDIRPFPGGMTPVSWPLVAAEMTGWIDLVNTLRADAPALCDDLAVAHCRFEQIHPFLDGNGRTGRLVLNLVLVRLGLPPVVIYKRDRNHYLQALRSADAGEPGRLGELIARAVLGSLYRFVLPAVAGPARLVPLRALAAADLSVAALQAAAQRGRLQAHRGADGQWRSSRIWVDDYRASRRRRPTD